MNKAKIIFVLISGLAIITYAFRNFSQPKDGEPWNESQLIQPSDLAKTLNNPDIPQPFIFNIGPSGLIKNAIEIGSAQDAENLNLLKTHLAKIPSNKEIVIYCGCCPFNDCPNIRPAFKLLNDLKFTNHKLLNLTQNLKVEWVDKGYPMN